MNSKMYTSLRTYSSAAKSFSDIPSPFALPSLGHMHLFSKIGSYNKDRLTEAAADLSSKYGPIFRLKFPGQEFVITTDADHISLIFQTEGQYPYRIKMEALEHYRQKMFGAVGVVPGYGQQWHKFRSNLTTFLQTSYIRNHYLEKHRDIALDFVKYIEKHKTADNYINDFVTHAMKYSIEAISIISPGTRIHCLESATDPFVGEVIDANCLFMDGLYRTYSEPPIWKLIKTKGYKNMEKGHNVINRIVNDKLEELLKDSKGQEKSFMYKLLKNTKLTKNEACLLGTEIFLGGIDSTATTLTMALYYLAKNTSCQLLAFDDVADVNHYYLRACIKETLRLSPTGGGHTRKTGEHLILGGYFIPKDTTITAFNSVTSRMEKYFPNADSFHPERWLRNESEEITRKHLWASLPFGHGPRICPGRRLAEQEILVALTEILKKFHVETNVNNVGMIYRMNRIPDKAVNIKFIPRNVSK